MSLLQRKVLLLNKNWNVIGVCSVRRSLKLIFKEEASIIDTPGFQEFSWFEWKTIPVPDGCECIRTPSSTFRVPEVILLHNFNKLPQQKINYGKRALYKRDDFQCMYCGERPKELTTDHVVPRAQGGKTNWDNCVTACLNCNSRKGNRTPEQAGMKLRTIPKKPKFVLFKDDVRVPSWENFLDGMKFD